MRRDEWIAAFATEIGAAAPSTQEIRELLELAGDAAHASERTAAPLSCWIAARAEVPLPEALAAAKRLAARTVSAGDTDASDC